MNDYIVEIMLNRPVNEDSYLHRLPVVKALQQSGGIPIEQNVTFFVGENGSGKSTLLEAVAVASGFNAEGGSRNFRFDTHASHAELGDLITIAKRRHPKDGFFLRAESFYNAASYIDNIDGAPSFDPPVKEAYGGRSLHEQSHGESFLSLVQNRFFGHGLYILDEPEAALSPANQMVLLTEIYRLAQRDSQFIIATHSPILTALPGADIYELSARGYQKVAYTQTDLYNITKHFLCRTDVMLQELLSESE